VKQANPTSTSKRWWLLAGFCVALLASGAPARAEESSVPTTEAVADHGVFLDYAPAPVQPVGVCLVDTGVSLNPSTSGIVSYREALDGGTPNDLDPELHGTLMAMLMAAPENGWGTVGVAPNAVRVISIRVTSESETSNLADYQQGITRCQYLAGHLPNLNIKVINLSLTVSGMPGPTALANLEDAVNAARKAGLNVVAAAGNEGAPQADYPAAYPPVLAVGGSDTSNGQRCSFSNFGTGVDLFAPGCELDTANPATGTPESDTYQGDSEDTAITSAALGALRAYDPLLSPEQAEALLTSTTTAGDLNIAGAFDAAGLGALTSYGPPPTAEAPPAPNTSDTVLVTAPRDPTTTLHRRLPRPRVKLRMSDHGHQLLIRVLNRPSHTIVDISVLPPTGGPVLQRIAASSSVFGIKTGRRLRLRIQFTEPSASAAASPVMQTETPPHSTRS
jgi:hypothetical protein